MANAGEVLGCELPRLHAAHAVLLWLISLSLSFLLAGPLALQVLQ